MKAVEATSVASVRGKLVAESVYVKAEKPARKTPVNEGPSKKELLASLEDEGLITKGLEGATREGLKNILAFQAA